MVNPVEKLKIQNQKLRNELKSRQEIEELGRERNRLLKQQKILLRQKKFGRLLKVSKVASSTGRVVGKGTAKVGRALGRGLFIIADNIAKAERRQQALQNKRRSPTKKTKTKVSKSRRKKK